jgi:anti-sigma B factor antagonist
VPLSFQSRPVGDITVVECRGRIVEGAESAQLQRHLNDLLPVHPHILLHLGDVDFIDSSGIGLLVRFLARMQNSHGNLKVCAVSPKISEVLRITKLNTIFDAYESEAEAIAGFYQRTRSPDRPLPAANILCVETSADVLAYVRELLRQAGYAVVTTGNLPDALTLLTAMRPKLVVIGAELRATRNTRAADTFNRLADGLSVIELPANFSSDDAGEAGGQLLSRVQAIIGESDTQPTVRS